MADVAVVVATVLIAIFTGLLWQVERKQQAFLQKVTLMTVSSRARFSQATNQIRVELVLHNRSSLTALLHGWEVQLTDGKFSQPLGDGELGKCEFFCGGF